MTRLIRLLFVFTLFLWVSFGEDFVAWAGLLTGFKLFWLAQIAVFIYTLYELERIFQYIKQPTENGVKNN